MRAGMMAAQRSTVTHWAVTLASQKMKDSLKAVRWACLTQKDFPTVVSLAAMMAAMLASQKLMDAPKVGHLGLY